MVGPNVATSAPRPLDRALQAFSEGDLKGVLRHTLPLIEQEPSPLGMALAARAGHELFPGAQAARALEAAVTSAIDAGNLPIAVAAASWLRKIGADPTACYQVISEAFGRGSPRLRERRAAPPELPKAPAETSSLPTSLGDAELKERLRAALATALKAAEARAKDTPLTPAPLFSSLAPEVLREFIGIFEARIVAEGERVVGEGEIGQEAFVLARGELDVTKAAPGAPGPVHLARLGNGALVGEMALLSRAPRAASVVAVRPSVLLAATKAALDQVAQRSPRVGREFAEQCRRRMMDNLARSCVLFRSVSNAERPALVERFSIRTFEPGERIVAQGRASEGLHIVASGDAAVLKQDQGERTILAHLGPGEILGEVALVLRRPAIAEVVAHHPTVTLFLPRERFLDMVRANPRMFVDLYELAVRRDEETSSVDLAESMDTDDSVLI